MDIDWQSSVREVKMSCASRSTVKDLKAMVERQLVDSIRKSNPRLTENEIKAELKTVDGNKCEQQHLFRADGDNGGYGRELGMRPPTLRAPERYDREMKLCDAECGLDRAAFCVRNFQQPIELFLHETNAPTPASDSSSDSDDLSDD